MRSAERLALGGAGDDLFGQRQGGLGHGDPRVVDGAKKALDQFGASVGQPHRRREIPLYEELERRLADIYGVGDAMVTTSGYLTNAGVIGFLLGEGDVAVCDSLIHGVISGVQWSGARRLDFRHNDPECLRFFITSEHTDEQLTRTVDLLTETIARAEQIPDSTVDR
ncbi:hypothetical protein [Nocardia arthritidis]|uniref:hypothetical protein n=1 Tax=Nocardia arthritidis TaxID=228602 RepID=UPI0007A3B401|nr:hypothetical protein [Nocardia arthritidis]